MWAVAFWGCGGNQSDAPKKIMGTWELHQVEIAGGEVEGQVAVLNGHPGCVWGRMTLSFEDDAAKKSEDPTRTPGYVTSTTDVLCPVPGSAEMYGCTVSARAPATWDIPNGQWVVADGTAVSSRTRPIDSAAMQAGTTCDARVSPGKYLVVPVRGQKWKWEMKTPDGTVLRLRPPTSERPDFVAALQRMKTVEPQAAGPKGEH